MSSCVLMSRGNIKQKQSKKLVYLAAEEGNDTIYKFSSLTRTQISEVQCGRNGRG